MTTCRSSCAAEGIAGPWRDVDGMDHVDGKLLYARVIRT